MVQRVLGSTRTRSARAPSRMRGGSSPATRAGAARERVDEARQRQDALAHEAEQERKAELEADHPGRGLGHLDVLVEDAVRRVVGRDAVDRPVGERAAQRLDVLGLAQGRVHLARGVVAEQRLVGEQQVVRRDLGRDRDAARLPSRTRRAAPSVETWATW